VGLLPGHPDLYRAIRRSNAREHAASQARWPTLLAALVLSPCALLCAGAEVALRRGGTVCVVARRAD
jgi:hypothetical protein